MSDTNYEPRLHKQSCSIGRISGLITGEQYAGDPILDTRVELGGQTLCWITWADKEKFVQELNDIINKYQI